MVNLRAKSQHLGHFKFFLHFHKYVGCFETKIQVQGFEMHLTQLPYCYLGMYFDLKITSLWSMYNSLYFPICRYADFLSRLNDDRNIRALFERALSSLPPEESVEVRLLFTTLSLFLSTSHSGHHYCIY